MLIYSTPHQQSLICQQKHRHRCSLKENNFWTNVLKHSWLYKSFKLIKTFKAWLDLVNILFEFVKVTYLHKGDRFASLISLLATPSTCLWCVSISYQSRYLYYTLLTLYRLKRIEHSFRAFWHLSYSRNGQCNGKSWTTQPGAV